MNCTLLVCFYPLLTFATMPGTLPGTKFSQAEGEQLWKTTGKILLSGSNAEEEKAYQALVQKQTFSDLLALYDEANRDKLKIAYPSFSPEEQPGNDGGFGFNVLRRLRLPLPDGETRTIEVNEHWPMDKKTGGIFFPDEIRIKTQVFNGKRRIEGAERNYLYDSFRVAWGPDRKTKVFRFTHYRENGSNKNLRVQMSAPNACLRCHSRGDIFRGDFMEQGETPNHESIVQDSFLERPLEKQNGYIEYLDFLEKRPGVSAGFISQVTKSLSTPEQTFEIPGMQSLLRKAMVEEINWMSEDEFIGESPVGFQGFEQGLYRRRNGFFLDAIEKTFPEKYLKWQPELVVPR